MACRWVSAFSGDDSLVTLGLSGLRFQFKDILPNLCPQSVITGNRAVEATTCELDYYQYSINLGHSTVARNQNSAGAGKQMFEQTFRNIDEVLWKEAECL